MALVTVNQVLGRDKTALREGYHNVFYEWVLAGLKSTLNNEFPGAQVYVGPTILKSTPPFSIRIWGVSTEIEKEWQGAWQRRYNIDIDMYSISKNPNENFYKQFYADMEHIHQVIFNNKTLSVTVDSKTFTWIDGTVGETEINEYAEEEEEIDGLQKASFKFSCLVEREG